MKIIYNDKEFFFTAISSSSINNHNKFLESLELSNEIVNLEDGVIIYHRKPDKSIINNAKNYFGFQTEEEKKKPEYIFSNMKMNLYIL